MPSTQTNDILFMQHAIQLAKEGERLGEIPVAAVIVKDDNIIAAAHNRRELDKNPVAHAEILAIQQAAEKLGDWRLEGCTVYVTLEPCSMCSGALWLSRVERVVFGCFDHKSGFLGSVFDLSKAEKLNHHYAVESGVLHDECVALLQNFFRAIRQKKKEEKRKRKLAEQQSQDSPH